MSSLRGCLSRPRNRVNRGSGSLLRSLGLSNLFLPGESTHSNQFTANRHLELPVAEAHCGSHVRQRFLCGFSGTLSTFHQD